MCAQAKSTAGRADTRLTYYAQTMPGVEDITWLEIRDKLPKSAFVDTLFAREKNGIVIFDYSGLLEDVLSLRTAEDVFLLVTHESGLSRDWKDLRDIANRIKSHSILAEQLDVLTDYLGTGAPHTFRVVARKEGNHNYRRIDVEDVVTRAVTEAYPKQLKFRPENADLELWTNVLGSELLIGLRISDRRMRHRTYKVQHMPASLRPSVAAAMVTLTQPGENDVFLEPMCGAGTIAVERVIAGSYRKLLVGDIAKHAVEATKHNLQHASHTCLMRWDAAHLPLQDESVTHAATNLPFGKKIGSVKQIQRLYPEFFREIARVLSSSAALVLLSSEYELVRNSLRNVPQLAIERGYSVSILGQWSRIYLVRKR